METAKLSFLQAFPIPPESERFLLLFSPVAVWIGIYRPQMQLTTQ